MKFIFLFLSIALSGCASIVPYGGHNDPTTAARVYRLAVFNLGNAGAHVQLRGIDTDQSLDRSVAAFDMPPNTYELFFQVVSVIEKEGFDCPANLCSIERFSAFTGVVTVTNNIIWTRNPYRIRAELKPGYVYMPTLKSATKLDPELCLLGEPIGAPGQRINRLNPAILTLSPQAEKIACGGLDLSITYTKRF
jgi:uncharacterized protein YceK